MAGWFASLMQKGYARAPRTIAGAKHADAGNPRRARDPRFDAIIQLLRAHEADDRIAREKRRRGYRQSLASDSDSGTNAPAPCPPSRLHKLRTKVPCRIAPDARALLDQFRTQFPRGLVTFRQLATGKQAVMITAATGAEPVQIGRVEHCVQTDPRLCNVRDQGLSVETDGDAMLVLRFRYPRTAVSMSARALAQATSGKVAAVNFTEIRPVLDLRPPEKSSSPRLVWLTRPEIETMNALQSRDYEAFYVRFKLEVQAGIWGSLSALLSSAPSSQWHHGTCYSVVREHDAAERRIYQRTVDDLGHAIDIGADQVHDASSATDILLLYLDSDILTDVADIYFTLQGLGAADAYFLKEELFTIVRRFWADSKSLASRSGSDLATLLRISQGALPMPAQAPLVTQDWTNLRQSLLDRYGEGGRKAGRLVAHGLVQPRVRRRAWPFETFAAGDVNVGVRVTYQQQWCELGAQRGEVICTVPSTAIGPVQGVGTHATSIPTVETIIDPGTATRHLDDVVAQAKQATIDAMRWSLDREGNVSTGARDLAAASGMSLEAECRESSRDMCTRINELAGKMAAAIHSDASFADCTERVQRLAAASAPDTGDTTGEDATTYVYSKLQDGYEVLTRPMELENIVLVAERLPAPDEIDVSWVRRHDRILAKVLLDESLRDTLNTIGEQVRPRRRAAEIDAKRAALYEHIRENILHYQHAVWQGEDPQQRRMRYRKLGRKVPLEWRFELESSGAPTIDDLCDRLAAPDVDGQFASYSSGREADLDQLIDPAGPIAYYGNYAVYRMRPEFGDKDAFSMLHFFKTPYLRHDPETGEPEVDDPEQSRVVRRIALDTDGVMIDVIRQAAVTPEEPELLEAIPEVTEAPVALQLLLENDCAAGRLNPNGRHDITHEWRILPRGERTAALSAGELGTTARTHGGEREQAIRARCDEAGARALLVGRARDARGEQAIAARDDGARLILGSGKGQQADQAYLMMVEPHGARASALRVGAGLPNAQPAVIRSRDVLRLGARPDAAAASGEAEDRLVLPTGPRAGMTTLHPGAAAPDALERLILSRDDGALRWTPAADAGAEHAHARLIFAEVDEWLRPALIAR